MEEKINSRQPGSGHLRRDHTAGACKDSRNSIAGIRHSQHKWYPPLQAAAAARRRCSEIPQSLEELGTFAKNHDSCPDNRTRRTDRT